MDIVFATNNPNKLSEVQALLGNQFNIISLKELGHTEDIPEPYETIEKNSAHKAQQIFQQYSVNVMAEDTGLEIAALDGAPGVYSARYAGESRCAADNIALVLENLNGIHNRAAHFKTVATIILNGVEKQFIGILKGEITEDLYGDNGFGYDPIFKVPEFCKTLAEMTKKEKINISHRTIAFNKLVKYAQNQLS